MAKSSNKERYTHLMYGLALHNKLVDTTVTKYNEDTGEPYSALKTVPRWFTHDGIMVTFNPDEIPAFEGYPQPALYRVVRFSQDNDRGSRCVVGVIVKSWHTEALMHTIIPDSASLTVTKDATIARLRTLGCNIMPQLMIVQEPYEC